MKNTKKRVVKAWAVIGKRGNILRVSSDGWSFFDGVFLKKYNALSHDANAKVVPCEITY